MTTFAEMVVNVSRDLRDTANSTFSTDSVKDLINAGLAELSLIAPERFQDDIAPVANTLSYQLHNFGPRRAITGTASTDLFSSTGHGLTAGMAVQFISLAGGAGLSVNTTYYVIASGLTSNAFKVSATSGGSSVDFTTDITAGLLTRVGTRDPIVDIEIRRVEAWDIVSVPPKMHWLFIPASEGRKRTSEAGWEVWAGMLNLTNDQLAALDLTRDVIRIQGYAPYQSLSADADVLPLSSEMQMALRDYCRVEAIKALLGSRELYTQWQTHAGNSDTTIAALMGSLNVAQTAWRQRSRALTVLRESF